MQNSAPITLEQILHDHEINTYIQAGNSVLGAIGFTEHGFAHAKRSSDYAAAILRQLGYGERTCELAAIAGYICTISATLLTGSTMRKAAR